MGAREAQADIEEADRKWQLTLKKVTPGDLVWDLLCVQLASYLDGDDAPDQKSDYDMMSGFYKMLTAQPTCMQSQATY